MTYLSLPDNNGADRRLVFYLSMEEYAAENLDTLLNSRCGTLKDSSTDSDRAVWNSDGLFFIWQVTPTVIFGRNQDMSAEVNVPYCREHGIAMYRRKSGGGCVFADKGNIMLSYIRRCSDISALFSEYLEKLAEFIRSLGIVHGTFLYDLDFDTMSSAITPSRAKLQSKGVKSVEQRVINLKSLLDEKNIGLEALKSALISYFCTDAFGLSEAQEGEISEIEKSYLDPSFIKGHIGCSDDSL